MIWGMSLEPGCIYNKTVSVQTHLSLATLDCRGKVFPGTDPVKVSHVVLKTGSCEQLVCSLVQGLVLQQQLNLQLTPNEEVAFSNQGNCCVYITGYSVDVDDYRMEEEEGSPFYPAGEILPDTAAYDKNTGWLAEEEVDNDESHTWEESEEETTEDSNVPIGGIPHNRERTPETEDGHPPQQEPVDVVCIAIKAEPEDTDLSDVPPRQSTPQNGQAGAEGTPTQMAPQREQYEMNTTVRPDCHDSQQDSTINSPETVGTISSEASDSSEPIAHADSFVDRENVEFNAESRNSIVETPDSPEMGEVRNSQHPITENNLQVWQYHSQPLILASKVVSQKSGIVISHVHNRPLRIIKPKSAGSNVQSIHSNKKGLDQVEDPALHNRPPRIIKPKPVGSNMHSIHSNKRGLDQVEDPALGRNRLLEMAEPSQMSDSDVSPHPVYGQGNRRYSARFQCRYCPKSLNCRRSLQNHEMIHTGDRPYQCRYCEKSFIQKSQWKVHERIHQGIKPFLCQHCGKAFSRRYNERMHTQVCSKWLT